MDDDKSTQSTKGMVDYDRNSAMQRRLISQCDGLLGTLVERVGITNGDFRIADFGCGPGETAVNAVRPAVEAYRALSPDGPVAVCHVDQPGNDWNALFALATGPGGYTTTPNVRTEAVVGTFYEPCLAAGSVALGTCFTASHWLSRAVRLHSPGTVWFADLGGDARAEMAALAQRDWGRFLHCRAIELRPGGRLLVATLGAVPDADEINGTAASGRGVYRAMQAVARDMAEERVLDRDRVESFVFGLWFLTAAEARQPLESDPVLQSTFEVEKLEVTFDTPDLFGDVLADPDEYARLYAGYIRAFAASSLRTALFEPSSDDPEAVVDLERDFFTRLKDLYRRETTTYAFEVWPLQLVLRRR